MTAPYNDHRKLVKTIAEILNLDKRVTDAICRSSLEFTASVSRDKENLRPIRLRHLGTLAIMHNKKKN